MKYISFIVSEILTFTENISSFLNSQSIQLPLVLVYSYYPFYYRTSWTHTQLFKENPKVFKHEYKHKLKSTENNYTKSGFLNIFEKRTQDVTGGA